MQADHILCRFLRRWLGFRASRRLLRLFDVSPAGLPLLSLPVHLRASFT